MSVNETSVIDAKPSTRARIKHAVRKAGNATAKVARMAVPVVTGVVIGTAVSVVVRAAARALVGATEA